jgi:hypothetical protein
LEDEKAENTEILRKSVKYFVKSKVPGMWWSGWLVLN